MSDLSKMSADELDNHFSIGYGGDDGKMMLDAFNACITRLRAANDDAATNPLYELTRLREQLRVAREGWKRMLDGMDSAVEPGEDDWWFRDIANETLAAIDAVGEGK